MRLLPILLMLPLFALQAHAQPVPAQQAPPPAHASPSAAPAAATAKPHRVTWQQHFTQANTTHDGHLTLQQAKDGYRSIVRHFTEIDASKKGYITVDDINAWHKLQRAMRHRTHDQSGQTLRPRPAMQHGVPAPQEMNTSTDTKLAPMSPPSDTQSGSDTSSAQPRHGT